MTDIVKRLRFLASGQDDPQSAALANAADEIERLREALSAMTELFKATEASAQWALSELRTALGEKELCLKKA